MSYFAFVTLTIVFHIQAPTAPEDVYNMLLELVESFDVQAFKEDEKGELVPIRPPLPGVALKERMTVGTSHLSPILRLPFSDMREVLKRVLRQDAARKRVAYDKGLEPESCTVTPKEFFKAVHDLITLYLREKTFDFWMWKLEVDLKRCNLTLPQLEAELRRHGEVSTCLKANTV